MKSIFALCILSLAIFAVAADEDAGDAIVLTNDNFENVTRAGSSFVLYYAPWCGHCKNFKPTWKQFASLAKDKLTVGLVNCDEWSGICRSYGIKGYPTALYQHEGKVYKFRMARTIENLQKFIDGEYKNAETQDIPTIDYSLGSSSDMTIVYIIIAGVVGVVVLMVIICAVCLDEEKPKEAKEPAQGEEPTVGTTATTAATETENKEKEPLEKKNQ